MRALIVFGLLDNPLATCLSHNNDEYSQLNDQLDSLLSYNKLNLLNKFYGSPSKVKNCYQLICNLCLTMFIIQLIRNFK